MNSISKKTILASIVITISLWLIFIFIPKIFFGIFSALGALGLVLAFPELGLGILINGKFIGIPFRGTGITGLVGFLLIFLSFLGLLYYIKKYKVRIWENYGILAWNVFLIAILLFIGSFYSRDVINGLLKFVWYIAINFYLFFAILMFRFDQKKIEALIFVFLLFGIFLNILSLGFLVQYGISSSQRLDIFNINAVWMARYFSLTILSALFFLNKSDKIFIKFFLAVIIIVETFFIFRTGSRAPFVSLFIAAFVYVILQYKSRVKYLLTYLSVLLAASILPFFLIQSYIRNRFFLLFDITNLSNLSLLIRFSSWQNAYELFKSNFFFGIGTGSFQFFDHINKYPHNIFLEFASELGIIGLLAFFSFIYFTFLNFFIVNRQCKDVNILSISNFMLVMLLLSLINACFSGAIVDNEWIWFASGGILATKSLASAGARRNDS